MCFITKAIDLHSEYVEIIAFSRQQGYVNSPQCYVICTLPVFYGVSLLRGKRKLRVFENNMLGKVFGLKMEEVSGGWIKLHNEGRDLYSSSILGGVSDRRREVIGARGNYEEDTRRCLVVNPEEKLLL
jgi:hypothetical protein